MTTIGWNALATLLFEDFAGRTPAERNLAPRFFLHPDPPARHFGMNRSTGYAKCLATELRTEAARYPHDRALEALLAELRAKSPRFERLWRSVASLHEEAATVLSGPSTGLNLADVHVLVRERSPSA